LLNRQVGGPRPAFLRGTSLRGTLNRGPHRPSNSRNDSNSSADSPLMSPELMVGPALSNLSQSYFNQLNDMTSADESSEAESPGAQPRHARHQSFVTRMSSEANTPSVSGGKEPPKFVGTPDYLAPESILGIGTDDKSVDWWALGVVLYEFIFGIPPFHAESPEKVFDNVISRRIDWHEDEMEVSVEAHDLMNRLMCSDPNQRLGARGADEVKKHAFFAGIDWDTLVTTEASFVPEVTDPESTDYFDSRGAAHGFHDEEEIPQVSKLLDTTLRAPTSPSGIKSMSAVEEDIASQDDFGTFDFKNLPVLKQANDDVIKKLRTDSMAPINQTLEGAPVMGRRPRSLSNKLRGRARRKPAELNNSSGNGPPSPSDSTSSTASTPSRGSAVPPSTPGSVPSLPHHFHRASELNALDRVKSSDEADIIRRASAPSRIRAGSGSSVSDRSTSMEMWRQRRQASLNTEITTGSGSLGSGGMVEDDESVGSGGGDRSLDVLIAEDNPISQKVSSGFRQSSKRLADRGRSWRHCSRGWDVGVFVLKMDLRLWQPRWGVSVSWLFAFSRKSS
jgi:serine/threonine-protein kinase RIM15